MMRSILLLGATIFLIVFALAVQDPDGDQVRGERAFREMKCASCHSVNGKGGRSAPDLGKRGDQSYIPAAMASAMWNHATTMWQAMDDAGIRRPQLTEQQAADLFAYFAGGTRPGKPGDIRRGQQIYQAKLCALCHDDSYSGAPSLKPLAGHVSSFSMVAAFWQHGGGMLARMVTKNQAWQHLTPEEMGHLIAYLDSGKQ
jgi:cytochrome c